MLISYFGLLIRPLQKFSDYRGHIDVEIVRWLYKVDRITATICIPNSVEFRRE